MRRVPALLLLLLALALAAVPGVALADDAGPVVLAQEEDGPVGPDPMQRDVEDNPARTLSGYEDPEVPFTWGAAWLLTFLGATGLVVMAVVYQLMVRGPRQRSSD